MGLMGRLDVEMRGGWGSFGGGLMETDVLRAYGCWECLERGWSEC